MKIKRKLKKAISAAVFSMSLTAIYGGVIIGTLPESGKGWNAGRILFMAGLGALVVWMYAKAYSNKDSRDKALKGGEKHDGRS